MSQGARAEVGGGMGLAGTRRSGSNAGEEQSGPMKTQGTTSAPLEQASREVPMLRIPRSAHPVPTTPRLRARWAPLWALGLAMVALLTVLLVGANLAGWMTTMGRGDGTTAEQVAPTGSDPGEIRGWMTIQAVLDSYPVTKAALYQEFTIPADTPTSVELREVMENTPGATLEIPALRTWLGEQGSQSSP